MTHDKAFQKGLELSIKEEVDYVIFRSEMNDYGTMPLDLYNGYSSDILAIFEKGIRIDDGM